MSERTHAEKDMIVLMTLDEPRYALYLSGVKRVVRAVEITSLPGAPGIVKGIIDCQGTVIPVIDIRQRFGLPERCLEPEDRFVIAHTGRRLVALVVDDVSGVRELTERETVSAAEAVPYADHLAGVTKIEGGLVLICDLGRFLSLDEEQMLDDALKGGRE